MSLAVLWGLWLGCGDDPVSLPDASPSDATSLPSASCTYRDVWFDLAGDPSIEEERGFDAGGRPLWHTVDGVVTTSWSYDDEGRPIAMQVGDPLAPDDEQAYTYGADGRLERVFLGDGEEVRFTWSSAGLLLERSVVGASGATLETTRWTYEDGVIVSWVVDEGGVPVLVAQRDTYEDGVSYLERQDDLVSGTWLEQMELMHPDGDPDMSRVATEQGYVSHTWRRDGEGWLLFAVWSTTGADWVQLADEVVYRFDERGREVSRAVEGEGASPLQRRERTWGCDVEVQAPFVPPLQQRPTVFYVSPVYVEPPLP